MDAGGAGTGGLDARGPDVNAGRGSGESGGLGRWVDGLVESRRGTLVQQKRERSVWRVEEEGRIWFAKRGTGPRRAEIRREAENAAALEGIGLGPPVIARGPDRDGEWIVLAEAPGESLAAHLRKFDGADRWVVLAAAARAVHRLHVEGFGFPDLSSEHVFVSGRDAVLIDSARLERRRGTLPLRIVARDLGTLVASLPRVTTTTSDRDRVVQSASGLRGAELARLLARVTKEVERLRRRTRWRHRYAEAAPDVAAALRITVGGKPGEVFDALIDGRGAEVVRTLPDRENRTLGRGADGRPLFYVKAFPPTRRGASPAMRELDAIESFQTAEIPVNRAAAWAEDVDRGSVIVVRTCAGRPLDDVLRSGVSAAHRRRLALRAARIWRRMREHGLHHRDAYACHVFVEGDDGGVGEGLRLIDLTRAAPAPWPRERWFVKDAAQLWHGARAAGATGTDAVRWLREYFRVPRLTREAKRFARNVAAKERRIRERQVRRAARGARGAGPAKGRVPR